MPGRAQSGTSSLKRFKRNAQANQSKSGECGQTGKFCHFLFSTAQPVGGTPPKVVGPPLSLQVKMRVGKPEKLSGSSRPVVCGR